MEWILMDTKIANQVVRKAVVSLPKEGIRVASVGNLYRFMVASEDTGGKYAMLELTVPPGKGGPFHIHTLEEEAFYVLEGEMTFYTDERTVVAPPRTLINFPIDTIRGFRNNTDRDVIMLAVLAPAGLENMWLEEGAGIILRNPSDPVPPAQPGASDCPISAQQYGVKIIPEDLPRH